MNTKAIFEGIIPHLQEDDKGERKGAFIAAGTSRDDSKNHFAVHGRTDDLIYLLADMLKGDERLMVIFAHAWHVEKRRRDAKLKREGGGAGDE